MMLDFNQKDKQILRELAKRVAEIASLPEQKEKISMWKRLNRLQSVKPLVWINEIPWHEMDVNQELQLLTSNDFCRKQEWDLRSTLYQWEHMRGDMVVEPVLYSPLIIHDSGFGIQEDVDILRTDKNNEVVSRHFNAQIREKEDIEKIKMPVVYHDVEATIEHEQLMQDIFGNILTIKRRGAAGFWFAPWDELIRWWGVQDALTDLYLRPEMVHKAMDRLVKAYLCRLDQYEDMGLLSLNNVNNRIGSGGLGFTDELPSLDFDAEQVRPKDLWGCGTAQIFSEVSPKMHEEFALQYEIRWMKRFGLNYYGCCEPLHKKIHMLEQIPNLRKISMSRWINVEEAAACMGNRFVFSYKPNPAIFASDQWKPKEAEKELTYVLDIAKQHGCIVEIIMKDISTLRYQPRKLWEWAKLASSITEKYS